MILKKLKVGPLLSCRLVNWKWNGVASEILRNNNEVKIPFMYDEESETFQLCCCPHCKRKGNLKGFTDCFSESTRNFPFAHYLFYFVNSELNSDDWNDFIDTIGKTIKGLHLHFGYWENPGDDDIFTWSMTKKMRGVKQLLLNELPILEQLGLGFNEYFALDWLKSNKLFTISDSQDSPKKSKSDSTTKKATDEDEKVKEKQPPQKVVKKPVRLPSLKVLYFDQPSYSLHAGIVEDLLKAAINLEKIDCFNHQRSNFFEIEDLLFLNSLGKLHLLKTARIYPSVDFFSTPKRGFTTLVDFRLTELTLDLTGAADIPSIWSDTAKFISVLFNSSKDTLKNIYFTQMGFLDGVKFPTFSKLNRYALQKHDVMEDVSLFPPGVRSLNIFPALREMNVGNIDWITLFPDDQSRIPSFQNMDILKVRDDEMTSACIEIMGLLFPNLKTFSLDSPKGISDFPDIGEAIWNHMKKLETLELKIDVESFENQWPKLDSCFTGIPKKACKRLLNKLSFMNLFQNFKNDEWRENQMKELQVSEVDELRNNVSILELKNLRKLCLHLYNGHCGCYDCEDSSDNSDFECSSEDSDSEDEFDDDLKMELKLEKRREKLKKSKENSFKIAVTDVSKIYAFQLLPNLTVDVNFVNFNAHD